jgi:hypothetical protein
MGLVGSKLSCQYVRPTRENWETSLAKIPLLGRLKATEPSGRGSPKDAGGVIIFEYDK